MKTKSRSRAISTVGRKGATFGTQAAAVRIALEAQAALDRSQPKKKKRIASRTRSLGIDNVDEFLNFDFKKEVIGRERLDSLQSETRRAENAGNVDEELRFRLEEINALTTLSLGRTDTYDHARLLFQLSKFWFKCRNTKDALLTAVRSKDILVANIEKKSMITFTPEIRFEKNENFVSEDMSKILKLEALIDVWMDSLLRVRLDGFTRNLIYHEK
ncbi:hypothetical protein HK096_005930 [Nowakowskiella sp. JEL0078]|nr:hypothetical protein HK096_005930 [Nowakowskiella sp. JEL0078]